LGAKVDLTEKFSRGGADWMALARILLRPGRKIRLVVCQSAFFPALGPINGNQSRKKSSFKKNLEKCLKTG
jgi:hypothetical protein